MSHETAEILREAAWGGDKAARRLPDDLGGPRWPWRVAEDLHTPQVIREAQRRPLAWD
jgi:hypothetical protein